VRARVLLRTAATEARRTLAYRVDFWVEAGVVFVLGLGVAWSVWDALFAAAHAERIGGLDRRGMVAYVVLALLVAKIARGSDFSDGSVSGDVYEGGLTRFLLYPVPYVPMKYAQQAGALLPAVVQLVLFGVPFLLAFATPETPVSAASLAMGAVSVVVANLLYFVMALPLQLTAFWAENVWGLIVMQRFVSNLLGGLMVPLAAFPEWSAPWLRVLPFRHFFSEPVETMLGRRSVDAWAASCGAALAWAVAFSVLASAVFRRGRLRYSGPGM
jgi:ABC-2 type transport system permease protein